MTNLRSYTFVIFLAVTLLCYYRVPGRRQWLCLLAASAVFYAFSGAVNFVFILLSAAATFLGALAAERLDGALKDRKSALPKDEFKAEKARVRTKKRIVLAAVLTADAGVLACLKYWNAAVAFLSAQTGAGLDFLYFAGHRTLLLPLGISFYTFQTLAYFLDVYNGKYACERNFPRYFLFVSFFPQLIQGPINRFDRLGGQLREEHPFDFENVKRGVLLILFGAMKKYCVADMLVERISALFDRPYTNLPGSLILLGILSFSIYQYADFSGGIDMAAGVSKLFGIEMQPNFRQPYFATSLADFWRRWHISLGLWMKDYVFFPLALTKTMQGIGKRCARVSRHLSRVVPAGLANIAVFLLVGIWHGPEMHYVLWGLFNGLVIALSDALRPAFDRLSAALRVNTKSAGFRVFQIARTFIIVNIGAYFDRIREVPKSFLYLRRTFTDFGGPAVFRSKAYLKDIFGSFRDVESQLVLIFLAGAVMLAVSVLRERKIDVYAEIRRRNIAVRWAAYYVPLLLVILSMSFSPGNPVFMYAQY